MTIAILILVAIQITLVWLFVRMLWRGGAPATGDAPASTIIAAPPVSSAAAPSVTPGGTLAT